MADPYDEYDGGLPLSIPVHPDGARLRIRMPLPSINWRSDPHRGPFYEIPEETPMLDLNQPLYDQHGNRWHALTGPDGRAFVTPEHVAFLVSEGSKAFPASFDVKRGGFLSSNWNDYVLSNTPPKPDWLAQGNLNARFDDTIVVRYGRRNGKLFAEVVE